MSNRSTKVGRSPNQAVRAAGTDGVGGLAFAVATPPGIGRLVRLPFYPDVSPLSSTVTTWAGSGVVTTIHPVVFTDMIVAFCGGDSFTLITPIVAWARMRVVGYEAMLTPLAQYCGSDSSSAYADGEVGPAIIVSNLRVGGGGNLFTHKAWADATIYDADFPEFVGLRDYPILHTPNQVTVDAAMVGCFNPSETSSGYRMMFACNLLCEILVDDEDGAHIPGPYARAGALVREEDSRRIPKGRR